MKKQTRKLGLPMLQDNIKRFDSKDWKLEENKRLLNLIKDQRINIEPCTLYGFDRMGLNHLEIINLSQCIGKKIHTLPASDCDFLNYIETKFNICFGYEKKIINKPHLAKVDHYCSGFDSDGFYPTLASAVFGLDLYI